MDATPDAALETTLDSTSENQTHPIWSTLAAEIATWTRIGLTQKKNEFNTKIGCGLFGCTYVYWFVFRI